MVSRSASVAARVRRIPSGLKTRDGARLGDFVPAGFATGPEWPSWADAAAPSAWIASVSLPQPGADVGLVERQLVSVGAPGARHRAVRDGGHPHATRRDLSVERDEVVGDDAARRAALEGRRLDDAVAQRQRTEPGGSERRWSRHDDPPGAALAPLRQIVTISPEPRAP